MKASKSSHVPAAELVNQRAEQARLRLAELPHQVAAAAGARDRLRRRSVKTRSICLSSSSRSVMMATRAFGIVLQDPLGEQHHHDALAAALRVPDDAALLLAHVRLRRLDAEILVRPRQLLHAAVEEHEVVHQLDQPRPSRTS